MTNRYILDENVVIFAQLGENESGESDITCLRLIEQIIHICHTLVIDPILWGKYHHQLNQQRFNHPQTGQSLIRIITNAVRMDGKVDIRRLNAQPFPEERNIPAGSRDDTEIVRLAVETGDTLVTTDGPLMEELNSCGIQELYGLQILTPGEALKTL